MANRLLIGSTNPSKLPYLVGYFSGSGVECVSPADIGLGDFDAEENGRTAEENAIQKALSWYRASHMPVMALDAGLVFLDLPDDHPDQPGVHVRRASGRVMSDPEMLQWFSSIAHRHGGRLRAAWQDSYCLLRNEDRRYLYTFDRDQLAPHAFWLVDEPCDKSLPGWPLNSISVDIATGMYTLLMTDDDRARSLAASDRARTGNHERLTRWLCSTALAMLSEEDRA